MWMYGRTAFACSASGITLSKPEPRRGSFQLMLYFPFLDRMLRIVHYLLGKVARRRIHYVDGWLWSIIIVLSPVQFLEIIPGFRDRETPIDGCPGSVPFSFPSTDFACYGTMRSPNFGLPTGIWHRLTNGLDAVFVLDCHDLANVHVPGAANG